MLASLKKEETERIEWVLAEQDASGNLK